MKTRTILLSLLGIVIYVILASFNSKMVKNNPPAPAQESAKSHLSQPAEKPVHEQPKAVQPADQEQKAALRQDDALQPVAKPEAAVPSMQLAVPQDAEESADLELLRGEMTRKDQQIVQLIDAQEAIAKKYQQVIAQYESLRNAAAANKDEALAKATEQLQSLAADRDKTIADLKTARASAEEIKTALTQSQLAGSEAEKKILEYEGKVKALEEKVQLQAEELGQLKTQFTDTTAQLEASRAAQNKAELKAEAMLRFGQTKEKQLLPLEELNLNMEKELKQNIEKLTEAEKTIASMREELAAHPQAMAVLQSNLDELRKKLDQTNKNSEAQKQELSLQVTALTEAESLARKEVSGLQTEAEAAQRAVKELESGRMLAQTAQAEAEKKLADTLAEKETQLQQFGEKEAAFSALQAQFNEQMATMASLNEEKLVLTGQLETAQASLNELESLKVALGEKTAALAEAQGKLEAVAALEAQKAEAETKIASLSAALEEKNLVLADTQTKLATLPTLEAQIVEEQTKNVDLAKIVEEKSLFLVTAAKQAEELTALQAQFTELQAKSNDLATANEENIQKINALEAEKTALAEQVASMQTLPEEISGLKASVQEKTAALAAAEEKMQELTAAVGQYSELQAKLTEAETALQSMQTVKAETEKKLAESENLLTATKQSLVAGDQKVISLKTELTAALAKVGEMTKALQQKQDEDVVPTLKQQIATLSDQVAELETAATLATKETDALNLAMKAKAEALQAAEASAQALSSEKETLQQSVNALGSEKETLQQSLNAGQVALTELQGQISSLKKELDELKVQNQAPAAPVAADMKEEIPVAASTEETGADSDKDGIADAIDLCPGSPAGSTVNKLGCADKTGIVLEGITFKTGTADLLPEAKKNLEKASSALKQSAEMKLEIAGYTDSVGDPGRNQQLSAQRAESVRQYFVDKGIPADRLSVKGYGSENPIANNATPAGRAKNRRVELHQIAQ